MIHKLKIKYEYLIRIQDGLKTFEVRLNDRDYQVGDLIEFEVLPNPEIEEATKDKYIIKYIHHGLGMLENYVVLGIKKV